MDDHNFIPRQTARPRPIILVAVYFFYFTIVLRTLAEKEALAAWLPVYLGLEFLFGILFSLVMLHPNSLGSWKNPYFIFQALLAVTLVGLHPNLDFTNVLLVLLCFQSALVFSGRTLWVWVGIILFLIFFSLILFLGIYGLALALLPATAGLVLSANVSINQEIEAGQRNRQELLAELQEANRLLTFYASQVDELSAIQERNRLARELHDSVSQTIFSINLHSRATRILLEKDPNQLRPQLERLQTLTHDALNEMRSLIADLRPAG